MKKNKIILVAIAPFYEGHVLWVNQLFDFLDIFTAASVFLPQLTLNEDVELESNKIIPLIATQYPSAQTYTANANIRSTSAYRAGAEQAVEKIKGYFTFEGQHVLLETFNDKLYWALSRQYEVLLSEELQATFHALQQGLISSLVAELKQTETDAVVVVPIEHAAILQECLGSVFETPLFVYGEDFLDTEG
jgi:hypothetical protein